MATEEDSRKDDAVAIELPAPVGWVKKVSPKKSGTPHRNDIVFISPTGEEIKTKRQLEQYLKSHPGGPAASEFDWATGDTPRRSARLSEKSKAVETSAIQSPTKKQKRSSTKRGAQENAYAEGEAAVEKDAAGEDKEITDEIPITDAKDSGEREAIRDQTLQENPNADNAEKKTAATKPLSDTNVDNLNSDVKESNDEATDSAANAKNQESEKPPEVLAGAKTSESYETTSEAPSLQNDESKDENHTENKKEKEESTPVETIDTAEPRAAGLDQENTKEKQEAEAPNDKDPALQETATGS